MVQRYCKELDKVITHLWYSIYTDYGIFSYPITDISVHPCRDCAISVQVYHKGNAIWL